MASSSSLRPLTQLVSLRNFLHASGSALSCRSFAAAASDSGSSQGEQGVAAKVQRALETALLRNDHLRDALVQRLGFAVKDVRMSPDNLKAFILWDSIIGQPDRLRSELNAQGPRLRAAVASALRARNAPQLVFRHDGLTPQQQEVEELLARLDAEAAAEAEAAAAAAEHVDAGKDEDATALQGWEEGLEEQPLDSTQAEQRQRWRR
ncbi:hypothetical protein ABPG77_005810 [Micractinium sp. CCAP 211/92]